MIGYLFFFSLAMAGIPWTLNSEIYPLHLRGTGNSIATVTNWITNFIVSISFLTILNDVTYGEIIAFMILALSCILSFVFVYFKVPETKGKSLDEIV